MGDICPCPATPKKDREGNVQFGGKAVICDDAHARIIDSEENDGRTIYLIETFDGRASQWVTRDRFRFLGEAKTKISAPAVRSDREIIEQTVELARKFASMHHYSFETDEPYNSDNPRVLAWWAQACAAQEFLTHTDPNEAVANLDEEIPQGTE